MSPAQAEEEGPKQASLRPGSTPKEEPKEPSPLSVKKKIDDSLQIPLLLQQREMEKQKEYEERAAEDIRELEKDLSEEDLKQMQELDRLFG